MKKQTENGVPVSVFSFRSSILSALAVGMVLAGTALADTYLATGGDITNNYTTSGTNYGVHIFTNTAGGTFTPRKDLTVEYLVVAGGGAGGGNRAGGGGGAGAVHRGSVAVEKNTVYDVIVGAGGAGTSGRGNSGGPSKFGSLPDVPGGGGGGATDTLRNGLPGGCGGGGGFDSAGSSGGSTTAVSPQEGFAGGNGQNYEQTGATGGGGGGAGGPGLNWDEGGTGGPGITSYIRDGVTEVTYAEGGLRGVRPASGFTSPAAEPDNTGNGGDGASGSGGISGAGGSGIVIIRYAFPPRGTVLLFR